MSMLSLKRGLDLLNCFDDENVSMSIQQLSARLDIPLSTLYRYLDIFTEQQFLRKHPETKQYHLGAAIHRLVSLAGSEFPFVSVAEPVMQELSKSTNETVILTVLINYRSVCVKKMESNRRVRLTIEEGSSQPLHAGASSRMLLAYQTDRFFDQWLTDCGMPRFTKNTICEPETMKQAIQSARQQGVIVSDSEMDEGAMAIAAPVFHASGKLCAALSLAGPRERLTDNQSSLISSTQAYAAKISRALGFSPAGNDPDKKITSDKKEKK
jgi:DNA-binding IclR family transcriptional regulator